MYTSMCKKEVQVVDMQRGSREGATTMIRVSQKTKGVLTRLKIETRETYEDVIRRLVENKIEENAELSAEATKVLEKRMDSLRKGKVMCRKEMLSRFKKRQQK